MMWNFVVSTLLYDACPILYDGSPIYPEPDALWKLCDDAGAVLLVPAHSSADAAEHGART